MTIYHYYYLLATPSDHGCFDSLWADVSDWWSVAVDPGLALRLAGTILRHSHTKIQDRNFLAM